MTQGFDVMIDAVLALITGGDDDGDSLDTAALLRRLMGRLRRSFDELVGAEEQHLDELANDAEPRQRRDRAVAGLRQILLDMRSLLRCIYGPDTALVLRRAPGPRGGGFGLGLAAEAEVMTRAHVAGAPTPRIRHRFSPDGPIGDAYVMDHVTGEALPKRILKDPAPAIAVGELADSSVNLNVRPWVNSADYWPVRADLLENIKIKFDEAGISIPFPQQDVYMHEVKAAG